MAMTSENMGPLAAEAKTEEIKRPNINNPVPIASKPILNAEQLKDAAEQMAALTPREDVETEDEFRLNPQSKREVPKLDLNSLNPYGDMAEKFEDEVTAEEKVAAEILEASNKTQTRISGKSIRELVEDDAYNLEVPIHAGAMYNPNALKVDLKDSNYIARWGNTNNIRQAQLIAQGFSYCEEKDIANLSTMNLFLDSLGHYVYADLVAMKIPKNIYYAGLRRAYLKSLHATNNKKAMQAGAAHAAQELNRSLSGPERTYLANQAKQQAKDIYAPVAGV